MATKYFPLEAYLRALPLNIHEITLTFSEIECILDATLPQSAFTYRQFWANQKDYKLRPQAHAWLSAGFLVETVKQGLNTSVRFRRIQHS